jgi:hypothetical protein
MAEPLTNAILASILHLIRRDLAEDGRFAPRRAPLRWALLHRAPAHRRHRCPCRSGPRAMTPPPHIDLWNLHHQDHSGRHCHHLAHPTPQEHKFLGQLAEPPEGITPVARLVRTPAIEEQERGSPMVQPLTRGTTDLMINDRTATAYHRADPPSLTPDSTNPNSNGLESDSPSRISPLRSSLECIH